MEAVFLYTMNYGKNCREILLETTDTLDKVADLIKTRTKNWNLSLLHSLYERSDALQIAHQPIFV